MAADVCARPEPFQSNERRTGKPPGLASSLMLAQLQGRSSKTDPIESHLYLRKGCHLGSFGCEGCPRVWRPVPRAVWSRAEEFLFLESVAVYCSAPTPNDGRLTKTHNQGDTRYAQGTRETEDHQQAEAQHQGEEAEEEGQGIGQGFFLRLLGVCASRRGDVAASLEATTGGK